MDSQIVYTVFRDDYEDRAEGESGMWNICFRTLQSAKQSCLEDLEELATDLDEELGSIELVESLSRNDCWVLDHEELGVCFTIMQTEIKP